jgi:hypothetical protein
VPSTRQLAESGVGYAASTEALGIPASLSYSWQRPLNAESERSALSQRIADPLYQAPSRASIVQNLLANAELLIKRWVGLLRQVAASAGFEPPSYTESEPEKRPFAQPGWNQSLQARTLETYTAAAAKAAGRSIGSLTESELGILQREYEEAESYLKEPPATEGIIVAES